MCAKCNQDAERYKDGIQNAELVRVLNTSDAFLLDVNYNKREKAWLKHVVKECGLDSLNNGFDSIQIRIWYGCALDGLFNLVILKLASGTWNAQVRELKPYYSDQYYSKEDKYWKTKLDSVSQKITHLVPKSGWSYLITELFNRKILSLPDQDDVEGFVEESATDGCGVSVEIGTKKVYRYYGYSNPDLHAKKNWQPKNILDILRLLNSEFRINNNWPSDKSSRIEDLITAEVNPKEKEWQDVKSEN